MNIVLYTNNSEKVACNRLQRVVAESVSSGCIERFLSITFFSKRLCRFPRDIDLVVILPRDGNEISELIPLRDLIDDIRVILVLPDSKEDTVTKGHLLRPVFVKSVHNDFRHIGDVVAKIEQTIHSQTLTGGEIE